MYAKLSKCEFGKLEMGYLGHIVSGQGVAADPAKVFAMVSWPKPATVKQLRGFLGLLGYYRKFVRDYGKISKPLTTLLQKNQFKWGIKANQAFIALKDAMSTTPVLALPDFS